MRWQRPVAPWVKDGTQFDLTNWGLLSAWSGRDRLGGALIAFDTAGVDMLGGRNDLAVIWDLRVAPLSRGAGIGRRLFDAVERWARERQSTRIDVETQNVNVPACRFYAAVRRHVN